MSTTYKKDRDGNVYIQRVSDVKSKEEHEKGLVDLLKQLKEERASIATQLAEVDSSIATVESDLKTVRSL